ncbi:MAG TPA: glycosyltransferase [Solirubrobacterales bacterium]
MTSRVDMHCHSTASQLSRLGVQRSLGLPECATPPQEVYELAKRRGMDFVTITDHDTIDGCLELADRPDCFVSEELTARFAGEPQAVHVLCYGITPGDHEWLQANAGDVEACAAYLHENEIACALAHPFYNVDAPLTRRHRRRLAELFGVWEVRNGSRAAELNMPAVVYIDTHGGTGIGGSDDHAGVDIGRTFTEAPAASTPEEFLAHLRRGAAEAGGEQGSAAKWAHAAMALATRALALDGEAGEERPIARCSGSGSARAGSGRWERGVDVSRFDPGKAAPGEYPGEVKVLYAGRLTREKGVELLAESFERAHRADPRLHLLLAGGGPEEGELRSRLGERATFLGWLEGEDLARAYASADLFLFCSQTDTYGQVVVEAGASGLPVVAVAEGGPASLIENRHTGLLCSPDPDHLAGAVLQLAASPLLRRHLGASAARAAAGRSWERSLEQLAAGYRRALNVVPDAARQALARAA